MKETSTEFFQLTLGIAAPVAALVQQCEHFRFLTMLHETHKVSYLLATEKQHKYTWV